MESGGPWEVSPTPMRGLFDSSGFREPRRKTSWFVFTGAITLDSFAPGSDFQRRRWLQSNLPQVLVQRGAIDYSLPSDGDDVGSIAVEVE